MFEARLLRRAMLYDSGFASPPSSNILVTMLDMAVALVLYAFLFYSPPVTDALACCMLYGTDHAMPLF